MPCGAPPLDPHGRHHLCRCGAPLLARYDLHQARGKQYSLPLPSLAQLSLPLVGRVAAGSPILAQEHIDRSFLMEASTFSRRPDYLLKVRGMSMKDAGIMDGDLLAVQKAKEAKNGQIVVARLGDDVTVKRFRKSRGTIELLPENPEFQPIVVGPKIRNVPKEGYYAWDPGGYIGLYQPDTFWVAQ